MQVLALINALLSFSSIFNGHIFSYDENGVLSLGSLSIVPFILSGVYILLLFIASVIKYRIGLRRESIFIIVLCLEIIAAVILNTFFSFKFLISGMAVLSCAFYYLFFTAQTLTRDAMTNALNRHSFYRDIENMKKRSLIIISVDLNGLKLINDRQGHAEGDRAISAVAEAAYAVLPVQCRLYRMGGDEFVILSPPCEKQEIERLTEGLRKAVSQKGYSIAVGYCEYNKGLTLDNALKQADAMMYEDKKKSKK